MVKLKRKLFDKLNYSSASVFSVKLLNKLLNYSQFGQFSFSNTQ